MILILIAIITAGLIVFALFAYAYGNYSELGTLAGVFGFLLSVLTGISAIVYVFAGWHWIAADHKAQIINREYGTSYTQAEVFYASDVINTVRELDRKRYEINGDILRGQEAKP